MREPNFNNLLKVLRCEVPERPTLFEFGMNSRIYQKLAGSAWTDDPDTLKQLRMLIAAFRAATRWAQATVCRNSLTTTNIWPWLPLQRVCSKALLLLVLTIT
ncbi:MAG: hypothetical protein KJ964_00525 [Verrucomicrobia bacterium]|nr:hypothetical protein [Verrucomicrobiota bacterium]MBU1736176.1 hypothetical protein [Verrucomicrobiota bacterium]MBU1856776.1 hypothetical protein [Verrucomicrobiota bacterium]